MHLRTPGIVAASALSLALSACGASTSNSGSNGAGHVINAAASIDAWGSILTQLGGAHVHTTSLIKSPDVDPHVYEPTPADGRVIATSQLFVENGIGYDPWAAQALAASPDSSRIVLSVGDLVGVANGGNPHRWYSPADVKKVADTITADLKQLDPADAAYFDAQNATFESRSLAEYNRLISDIKKRFGGTPVGASESIFAPLSDALGLNLVTPAGFLRAISEGTDPSPADLSTITGQITGHGIKVYVYNSQNATPDVAQQVKAAQAAGIPVAAVTETLSPEGSTFQDWQVSQLRALEAALARATGK